MFLQPLTQVQVQRLVVYKQLVILFKVMLLSTPVNARAVAKLIPFVPSSALKMIPFVMLAIGTVTVVASLWVGPPETATEFTRLEMVKIAYITKSFMPSYGQSSDPIVIQYFFIWL